MKKLYLDWNTISHLSSGYLPQKLFEILIRMKQKYDFTIFYSHEHIDEMIRIQKNDKPISDMIKVWCSFITDLTENNYWRIDPNSHIDVFEIRAPIDLAINAIKDKFNPENYPGKEPMERYLHSLLSEYLVKIKDLVQQQSNIDLNEIDTTLPISDIAQMGNTFFSIVNNINQKSFNKSIGGMKLPQKLGNLSGGKLDDTINNVFSNIGINNTISELVENTKQFQPNMDAFTPAIFNTLYEMSGFKKDSNDATYEAKKSDNQHLIFGLRSDVFITHDRKLYYRSIETKRHFKECNTSIIYAKNAISELENSYG